MPRFGLYSNVGHVTVSLPIGPSSGSGLHEDIGLTGGKEHGSGKVEFTLWRCLTIFLAVQGYLQWLLIQFVMPQTTFLSSHHRNSHRTGAKAPIFFGLLSLFVDCANARSTAHEGSSVLETDFVSKDLDTTTSPSLQAHDTRPLWTSLGGRRWFCYLDGVSFTSSEADFPFGLFSDSPCGPPVDTPSLASILAASIDQKDDSNDGEAHVDANNNLRPDDKVGHSDKVNPIGVQETSILSAGARHFKDWTKQPGRKESGTQREYIETFVPHLASNWTCIRELGGQCPDVGHGPSHRSLPPR